MKRLRAVKKWKLLFWAVLLLVILALEAFYLRERPLGNKTAMPAANGESISMTDGMEVSEFINCQQERLEGMILQTQKDPQAETGILQVQLYQEGKLIQEWSASQYSYRGTQLKLVLEQPLEQVKGTELEVRLQGTGGDTGIILSTNQHSEEGIFLNGGEKANTRLCLSLIRENVDTGQVFLGSRGFYRGGLGSFVLADPDQGLAANPPAVSGMLSGYGHFPTVFRPDVHHAGRGKPFSPCLSDRGGAADLSAESG